MKKRTFKRGGAGVLAVVLACVMAITSYSPLTAYADDEHYDITPPVIENVTIDNAGTYKQSDTAVLKAHIYDLESGLEHVNIDFRGTNQDDASQYDWENCYYSIGSESMGEHYSYDETTGVYTFDIPMRNFKLGYKYSLSSITAYDAIGNYATNSDTQFEFTVENQVSETAVVKDISITNQNGESVIGQQIDDGQQLNFNVAIENSDDIESITLEFKKTNDESNSANNYYDSVYCYKNGDGIFSVGSSLNGLWDNSVAKSTLVKITANYNDGTKETISLGEFNNIFVKVKRGESTPSEDKYSIEYVKYYKADGSEVKSGDIFQPGDTINVEVRSSGLTEKIVEGQDSYIILYAQANNVSKSARIDITQDSTDYNLFKGTLTIDENMYPTVWRAREIGLGYIYYVSGSIDSASFIVKSKAGDVVIPTIDHFTVNYVTWEQNVNGQWVKCSNYSTKENVTAFTALSSLDLNLPEDAKCPIEGGKFTGWHVFSTEYDSTLSKTVYKDLGPVDEYLIADNDYSVVIEPVFDKEFHYVSGYYYDSENQYKSIEEIREGKWNGDTELAEISAKYKGLFYSEYGFDKFENTIGSDGTIYLNPTCKNKEVDISYTYVSNKNELKYAEETYFIPVDNLNNDTIKAKIDSFKMPADNTTEYKFDKWEYNNVYLGTSSPVISIHTEAKYAGKDVVIANYNYKAGDIDKIYVVDESISVAELKKLIDANTPKASECGGADVESWSIYNDVTSVYNYLYVYEQAKIKNVVVRYYVYGEDDEEDIVASDIKILNVGDTITIPTKIGNCYDIKWDYMTFRDNDNAYTDFEDVKETVATEPGVYYIEVYYGGYKVGDSDNTTSDPTPTPTPTPTPNPTPSPTPTPTPAEKPAVKLDEATVSNTVSKIKSAVEEAKKETTAPKVEIDMGTATVVPVEVLEAAKGSNVDVVLKMNGYTWTINGEDIKSANLKDINLEVTMNTNAVPTGLVSKLAGDKPTMQISLTHNGDFGFKATLTLDVGKENAGQFGNLYYYDSNGKLVFMNAGKIAADGSVGLSFSHASDYVIVIGEDMTPAKTADAAKPSTTPTTKKSAKTGDNNNGMLFVAIMGLGLVAVTAAFARKKRA